MNINIPKKTNEVSRVASCVQSPNMLDDDAVNGEINTLNAELNPIYNLLALLGVHHFLHVSRIKVKCPPEILYGRSRVGSRQTANERSI